MKLIDYLKLNDIYLEIQIIWYRPNKGESLIYQGNGQDAINTMDRSITFFNVLHVFTYSNIVKLYVEVREEE